MSRSRFTDLTHILKTGHALKKIVEEGKIVIMATCVTKNKEWLPQKNSMNKLGIL